MLVVSQNDRIIIERIHVFWDRVLWLEFDNRACEVINPTRE